ncbi:glutamine-hydrolyzing carbamoyl-phosphate synthase small subunit [Elusimicrobiota bacterium]
MVLRKAVLALESGRIFVGNSFGSSGEKDGEIVFNTSITGYQEILTDPSYNGQIICMTQPHIGNYGVNLEDMESKKSYVSGFVVREMSPVVSNWRANGSLSDFLNKHNVIGIEGIDTRALTRHIREAGAMKAVLSTERVSHKELIGRAKKSKGLVGRDLVKEVTVSEKYIFKKGEKQNKYRVAVIDCGCKNNILQELSERDCEVIVFPASVKPHEILEINPTGVMLSNGPGDPSAVMYAVETIKELIKKNIPMFGICLGHQLLSLALGGETYKFKSLINNKALNLK